MSKKPQETVQHNLMTGNNLDQQELRATGWCTKRATHVQLEIGLASQRKISFMFYSFIFFSQTLSSHMVYLTSLTKTSLELHPYRQDYF